MADLSKPSVIKDLLQRYGFSFSKALGQNFLINPSVCPRMAEQSGAAPGVGVIEIGAGIGVLTKELSARAEKVVCIEIDERLLPILEETLADCDNVTIINEDVLKVDLERLIREEFPGMEVVVCANLPYYITSPILMYLLEAKLPIRAITVMVQKEAAARITAAPGSRAVGAISFAIRYYSEPTVLFQVSRGSFLPAPEVDSTVIRLDLRPNPSVSVRNETYYFEVIKGAFSQRRKTLANSLSSYFGYTKESILDVLRQCGLPETIRVEQCSEAQLAGIADTLSTKENNHD